MREKQFLNISKSVFVLLLFLTGCAVTGEEEAVITVSPESAVVILGDTEQFSVTPAGTVVTWSVEGILGGNEGTVGKIDTAGKYTAPADANVAPEQVVIMAADTTGASASAVAFLTTFGANKKLTTQDSFSSGISISNTYSSGQKNIAVFKESDTVDVKVYAVWSDNSSGSYKVYFAKSVDGGISFGVPVPVDDTSGEQFSPAIAVDDSGDVFIVWEDHFQGDSDIFLRRYDSLTGFDLQQTKQINPVVTDISDYNTSPSIAISSDEIYVIWERRSDVSNDYPDIRFARSINLGSTFSDPSDLSLSGRRPVVVMDSAGVAYVAWEDLTQFPSLPSHTKLRKISGGIRGDTTLDIDVASDVNARYPSIAVDPACNTQCEVYVVWQRAIISTPKFETETEKETISSYNIGLTIINGETLEIIAEPITVPDSGSSGMFASKAYPAVAADDSNIYIVWDDLSGETKNVYFTKSSDGENFATKRIVNDDVGNNSSGISWHEKPGIAVAGEKAYVIWTDYRNTQLSTETTVIPTDVFFAVEQ